MLTDAGTLLAFEAAAGIAADAMTGADASPARLKNARRRSRRLPLLRDRGSAAKPFGNIHDDAS